MVGNPYMVGSPHTWWPGQPAGQLWGARGGPAQVLGIKYLSNGYPVRMVPRMTCILRERGEWDMLKHYADCR